MNHLIEVLTAVVLGASILGGLARAVSKLTRIADSVERLSTSVERVVEQIGDHEKRIAKLEDAPKPARTRARP
jgi:type II secretory pathway component PulJ